MWPLKEVREERLSYLILHRLKGCPYVRGDALHTLVLLIEGILQYRNGGQWVLS